MYGITFNYAAAAVHSLIDDECGAVRRASILWRDIYIYPPDIFRIYKYSHRYLYIRGTPCRATAFPFRIMAVLFGNLTRGRHLRCRRRFSGIPTYPFQHSIYRIELTRNAIVSPKHNNRYSREKSILFLSKSHRILSPAVWSYRIFFLRSNYAILYIQIYRKYIHK